MPCAMSNNVKNPEIAIMISIILDGESKIQKDIVNDQPKIVPISEMIIQKIH